MFPRGATSFSGTLGEIFIEVPFQVYDGIFNHIQRY